jgi:nicotinamidase-related amidase
MNREIILNGKYYSENITPEGLYKPELFGYRYEEHKLNTSNTVFMLIDVYGKGYDRDDPEPIRPSLITREMFKREKEMIVNKIIPARDLAKKVGFPVVYVTNYEPNIASSNGEFGKMVRRMHGYVIEDEFSEGNPAIEFSNIIAPGRDDYLVKKQMYDGFFETCLDSLLRNLNTKNIIAVGFAANVCLLATLHSAYYRNYRIILLGDCTLGVEYPDTEKDLLITREAVRYIERYVGFTVTFGEFKDACLKVL